MAKKKCRGGVCGLKNLARQPSPASAPQPSPYQVVNPSPNVQQVMAPLNQQNPSLSIGQQFPGLLSQGLSPQQGSQQQAQIQNPALQYMDQQSAQQPVAQQSGGADINSLLDKVDAGAPLQPQEAQALSDYVQQYLPQQQGQQYNPQDYIQGQYGSLGGQGQSQNVPYEQSPFFQFENNIQQNPNVPSALKQRAKKPGFFKKIWNGIKNIFKGSPVGLAAQAIQGGSNNGGPVANMQQGFAPNGSPGSVQAGQAQDPYGLAGDAGRSQVLSPNGQQRGFWSGLAMGEHPEVYNVSKLTPYQQRGSNYLLDQGLRGVQNYNPNFAPIANQQLENFYSNTVPSIAERFTSMGGGQRSSAFQGALAQAGRGLHGDLAAQNQQFNQQNLGHFSNLLNYGLQPRFDTAINPATGGIVGGGVKAVTEIAKAYAGAPRIGV